MAKVRKIMQTDVPVLKKEDKIKDAIRLISNKLHGAVVIVEDKKPIGIVTETDIIRNVASKKLNLNASVQSIMNSPVTSVHLDTKLEKASKIIDTKHYRKYPVVENENLIGLVTENDIVHALGDNMKFHRNLQNVVLILLVLFEFFVFIGYRLIAPILG